MTNKILIYNDRGVSLKSYEDTLAMCQRFYADSYNIQTVSADSINHTNWEMDTHILIIPGGRATPYFEALHPIGNQKIKNFVASGGHYLGICAGGYYGASHIIFENGHPQNEIITDRALALYSGTAEGPAYDLGVFEYNSEAGARVGYITTDTESESVDLQLSLLIPVYFNGGCYFHSQSDLDTHVSNVSIIAKYADHKNNPAAIIAFAYGKGKVCLSGVHFESVLEDGLQYLRDDLMHEIMRC